MKQASVVWKPLKELYEKKIAQNKAFLFRKLMHLRYTDGTPISNHLNIFSGIVNHLTVLDIKFDNEIYALCLMSSLPDSWENLVVSLSNSAPHGTLTLKMLKESINAEFGNVKMGNNTECRIAGMGDVHINTDAGRRLCLKNVRHVLEIRPNLIFTGIFDDEGYHKSITTLVKESGSSLMGLWLFAGGKVYGGELNAVDD
ncbi:hypothetical protein ZIOFF_002477 [Zingiber officinale]|uniref:Uncharacterized protein n=1 Tax=Zingiber officinale TaxID=94328 RepID=A0A8J5HZV8_ZINOF|nr:hypothetical protein ZIOFF_002477 [Zingiber officinale]